MRGDPKVSSKVNITISVDGQIADEIRQYAEKQKLSTNSLLNKVLKEYVMFGKYFQDHIPVVISPEIFSYLVGEVDEKIWVKSWEIALGQVTPEVFAMHNLEPNLDNLVRYLLGDIGPRVGIFDKLTFSENEAKNYKLVMVHKYGIKWSRVLATSFSNMFVKAFPVKVTTQVSTNAITIKIYKK
jgi:hypothetical protein